MYKRLQQYWKKIVVLFFIGFAINLLVNRNFNLTDGVFLSDMFFIIAMVFIVSASWELVSNLGLFNSMVFGTKCFYRVFRQKIASSEKVKDEYLEFTKTRHKYGSVSLLLLIGIGLLGIAALPILLSNRFSVSQF